MQIMCSGIPLQTEYRAQVGSSGSPDIEAFSQAFSASNQPALAVYARRWARDPLPQWSRQWEYAFVLAQLEAHFGRPRDGGGAASVLESSGMLTISCVWSVQPTPLPWKPKLREDLLALTLPRPPRAPFFERSVCCGAYRKSARGERSVGAETCAGAARSREEAL